jgi:hypothetical protein
MLFGRPGLWCLVPKVAAGGDVSGCRRTWFVWTAAELMLNRCLVVVDWVCGCCS